MSKPKNIVSKYWKSFSLLDSKAYENYDNLIESEISLTQVAFFDSLDNKEFNMLLRRLYNLPSNLYKVSILYKKPSKLKDLQFLSMEFSKTKISFLASIECLQDEFIDNIKIVFGQRSNYSCMVEYDVTFKKPFSNRKSEYEFIISNKDVKNRNNIYFTYHINNPSEMADYEKFRMHDNYFRDMLQSKIMSIVYSPNAQTSELLSLFYYSYPEMKKENMKPAYLEMMLKNKNNDTVIEYDPSETLPVINVFYKSTLIPQLTINNFTLFRNDFYYGIYGKFVLQKLNNEISQYAIRQLKRFKRKKLSWLLFSLIELNSITDNKDCAQKLNQEIKNNWEILYGSYIGEENENADLLDSLDVFSKERLEYIRQTYQEQYSFYKTMIENQTSKLNTSLSISAVILSIFSIILSLILR